MAKKYSSRMSDQRNSPEIMQLQGEMAVALTNKNVEIEQLQIELIKAQEDDKISREFLAHADSRVERLREALDRYHERVVVVVNMEGPTAVSFNRGGLVGRTFNDDFHNATAALGTQE